MVSVELKYGINAIWKKATNQFLPFLKSLETFYYLIPIQVISATRRFSFTRND